MADFMADHPEKFVVSHYVHKSGVDSDAAVGAGESVDIVGLVDFEIERDALDGGEPACNPLQTDSIWIRRTADLALGVKLGDILMHIRLHLSIGDRHRLGGHHSAIESPGGIERLGA